MRAALFALGLIACGRISFDPQQEQPVPPAGELAITVASFETSSNAFTPIPDATIVVPPADHRWLLVTTATLQSTSLVDVAAEVRYLVDGVERGIGGTHNSVLDHPGPFQHYAVLAASEASQTVAFELRDASTGTARIEQLRAYVVPLPDGAAFDAVDPITTVTATKLMPAITFKPTMPSGEYLFFALANTNEATGSDCHTRWLGASGAAVTNDMQMPRQSLQSQLVIWRETFTAGASIVLEANVTSNTGELRYVRLLAIPTAGLPYTYSERTTAIATTTEQVVHDLTPSFEAERYLWIASAQVEPDCMNVAEPSPDLQVVFDGVGVTPSTIAHIVDNCAYQTTFGVVEVLDDRPGTLATSIRSGNARGVRANGSQIVLLGL